VPPGVLLYVCGGVIGFPALIGRTEPMRQGETGTSWMWLFHVIPLSQHTIHVIGVDGSTRSIRTHEHGGRDADRRSGQGHSRDLHIPTTPLAQTGRQAFVAQGSRLRALNGLSDTRFVVAGCTGWELAPVGCGLSFRWNLNRGSGVRPCSCHPHAMT
jgi:hypothetical protein